jgi:hypothetical protein
MFLEPGQMTVCISGEYLKRNLQDLRFSYFVARPTKDYGVLIHITSICLQ